MCLTLQADERKAKLLDAYDLQRFLSDFRDLQSWISSMMALVSSDELAKDVTGAEALLERHQVGELTSSMSSLNQTATGYIVSVVWACRRHQPWLNL